MKRRHFIKLTALGGSALTLGLEGAGCASRSGCAHSNLNQLQQAVKNHSKPQTTLSLEEMAHLGSHHLEHLVDRQGRTYFDVFLTKPPEAVTDWPDFIDLPARYWEAGLMIEPILGRAISTQDSLRSWLFSRFETDGLAYRPESPISSHVAELFDQSRLLYALTTAAMQRHQDEEIRQRLIGLSEGLLHLAAREGDIAYIKKIGIYFGGTLIRPMLQAGQVLNRPDLIEFSGALARGLMDHSDLYGLNGTFKGHVHAALAVIAGTIAYGVKTDDKHLLERGRNAFEYVRSISTSFGFVPELSQRADDMIGCETCALMDYLDAALLLARHVDSSYWDVVEKATRNHLWESQIRDGSWIGIPSRTDEEGVIRAELPHRLIGGFAGWSGPHCLLAYHEHYSPGWVKTNEKRPLYTNKVRALQNCCSGAGIRAVHQVWSNIVTISGSEVSINLSLDRATPEVHVTSYLPFEGRVRVNTQRACTLRWRKPGYCSMSKVEVLIDGQRRTGLTLAGDFVQLGTLPAHTQIEFRFPVPERNETQTIGNSGYQQYRFDLCWAGDTILSIKPDPANVSTGFSKLMGRRMPTSYSNAGIGPIYQRQSWRPGLKVKPASLVSLHSTVDWYRLA